MGGTLDSTGTDFLAGEDALAAAMRALDWTTSPLGPPAQWPESLKATVGLMLAARAQIVLFWGPDYLALYNDAYAPTVGDKHPRALGRPAVEHWAELWHDLEPLLRGVRETGETFAARDRPFYIERHGYGETVYFDVSYSPVRAADGQVGGVLCIVSETTERVRAEAALRESEARLRFLDELDEALRGTWDAPTAMQVAAERLALKLNTSRCTYADVDTDVANDRFVIRSDYTAPGIASSTGTYSLGLFGPRAAKEMHGGRTLVVHDVAREFAPGEGREMFLSIGIGAIVCCPLLKDGRLVAMMAVHQDVARHWQDSEVALVEAAVERCWAHVERVGAQARLRDSEEFSRRVLASSADCIEVLDLDGRVESMSEGGRRALEIDDAAPLSGTRWAEGFEPDGRAAAQDAVAEARQGSTARFRAAIRTRHGALRWWDTVVTPVSGRDGRPEKLLALSRDMTELRRADDALRELNATLERRVADALAERQMFAAIVEATDAPVQVIGLDYRFLAINRAAQESYQRLFGVRPEVGQCLADVMAHVPDQYAAARRDWGRALAGESFSETSWWGDRSRARYAYEMRFRPLLDADGQRIGAYLFGQDVTERLREQERLAAAEEQLRQSQKMEAMGQLTGGVAHDFNNLLTPIVGSLDLLQRKGLGGEREQRLIAGAAQSAERAKLLVQRLLAFARRQPLQPTAVDVARLVQGMGGLVASTTGPQIKVEVTAAPNLPPAQADPNQVEMALLNLAVNARDAMPDGGTLRIAATAETIAAGHPAGLRAGTYVRLSVTDDGVGMDQATLARAVEPFFSTKGVGKGTGLGLSMVHGLASQLGGALAMRSRPGQGTDVVLWLPRSAAVPASAGEAARGGGVAAATTGTVLLVDDEELVRMSTADMLADLGYAVVEATSAEQALHLLEEGATCDLVVTDHLMPGMTGAALARALRVARPRLPVLLVSGYAEREGIEPGLARLTKPFRKHELAQSLAEIMAAA